MEWSKTLDGALPLALDTVIPGHRPVTNKAGLQTYRDKAVKLRERVAQQIRSRKSQAEIAKFMETEYRWAPHSLQQQWRVPGYMTETTPLFPDGRNPDQTAAYTSKGFVLSPILSISTPDFFRIVSNRLDIGVSFG